MTMKTWPKGLWREVPTQIHVLTGGIVLVAIAFLVRGDAGMAAVALAISWLAHQVAMLSALVHKRDRQIEAITEAAAAQEAEVRRLQRVLREHGDTVSKAQMIVNAGRHAGR